MNYQELFNEFTKKYEGYDDTKPRGIGIEMEMPLVTQKGEAVSISVIQDMYEFLEKNGFQLERDNYTKYIVSASRINSRSIKQHEHQYDTIMTDVGNSTLEIVLAPQQDLHTARESLSDLTDLLVAYFATQHCKILGYGIQPITPPSRKLLMTKERYFFYEQFSTNNTIPKPIGSDAHFLTLTASNQCHIDVSSEEIIPSVNVLNALSGLQIILNANSPIWQGRVDPKSKANRESLWEKCFPNRLNQLGVPPKFNELSDYISYILEFKPMLVKRKRYLKILNKSTFKEYLFSTKSAIGQTLEGEKEVIDPRLEDLHMMNSFCYFNARLAPRYGTVESRMCCQQPQNAALAPTAVTLGLLSNLKEAKELVEKYSWDTWKKIRSEALKRTFKTTLNGGSIIPLLVKFLEIARKGLLNRNMGEEIFLTPMYERISRQRSPADDAIEVYSKEGLRHFLNHIAYTSKDAKKVQTPIFKTRIIKKKNAKLEAPKL